MSANVQQLRPQSDEELMQQFIDEHGEAPSDSTPESHPPQKEPEKSPEDREESPEDREDGLLDYETLEELGLIDPKERPESGSQAEGDTETPEVDLLPFSKALGVDPQELSFQDGEIMVRTKVDGEVATVPLRKLREGYQLKSHFTRQQEQFLEERRNWEESRQQAEQQFAQQATLAHEILEQEEAQLRKEYTRDWETLRKEDPAEYAAGVAEFNHKLQQIRQRKEGLVKGLQTRQQEMWQQQQQQAAAMLAQEAQRLVEATGWTDPQDMQKNTARLRSYLVEKQGLSPEMVDAVQDHRVVLIAEKARKYDELMGRVEVARKRVSESHPMPAGPGAKQPSGRKRNLVKAKQQLAKDHSIDSAANVFREMGID